MRRTVPRRPVISPMWILALAGLACVGPRLQEVTPLIEYERSGGIQGIAEHLVIAPDGRATLTRNEQTAAVEIGDDALARLRAALEALDLASIEVTEASRGGDLYRYRITHDGTTLRAREDVLPAPLRPVVEILDGILNRV